MRERTVEHRFGEKCWYDPATGCVEWMGSRNSNGYGQFFMTKNDRPAAAHRVAFALGTGGTLGDYLVCHTCDNPVCVNPEHLWLGTQADNMRDCSRKGRARGRFSR